jgi:hypothetical protein
MLSPDELRCQPPKKDDPHDDDHRQHGGGSTSIALAIAGTVVLGTIGLMAPFVSGLRHKFYLPYMATPKDKVRKALQHAVTNHVTSASCSTAQVSHSRILPRKFLDLGSGDGEAVYQAVQITSPVALDLAVGVELNPTLYTIASLRRLTWTSSQRRRSLFLCGSFWKHPLRPYSVVMIFGVPPLMSDLSDKIHRECEPGTVVLSYRFPLPPAGDSVVQVQPGQGTGTKEVTTTVLVRQEDEMFTYVLKESSVTEQQELHSKADGSSN